MPDERRPIPKPMPFQWPPRRISPSEVQPAATETAGPLELNRSWRSTLQEAIDDTRRVWLDMTLPRLDERLTQSGFIADASSHYCVKCGMTIAGEPVGGVCEDCENKRPYWERVIRLGTYTPPLADVIRQIKFSRWRRLGTDLGRVMGRQLLTQMPSPRPPVVLVPVPMSWRRRFIRGMDHTLALCRGIQAEMGRGARIAHLLKRRHGPSQLQVLPSERPNNVGRTILPRTFAFRSVSDGSLVVVVDDVMTTGATMRSACRAVREGLAASKRSAPIWSLIAARTELADGDRDEGGDSR